MGQPVSWFECSEAANKIVGMGGQILLPMKIGDAQVTFSSRWALARAIDQAIADAVQEVYDANDWC